MEKLNEASFRLLQRSVTVYEVDNIDCELRFEGKTVSVSVLRFIHTATQWAFRTLL